MKSKTPTAPSPPASEAVVEAIQTFWQDRTVGHGHEAPDQLLANPLNWRIHPKNQKDAAEESLDRLGWLRPVLVNKRTGHVIDGHMRVDLAIKNNQPTVPVDYLDLTEEEEREALLIVDAIARQAGHDKEQLAALAEMLDFSTRPNLKDMLGKMVSGTTGLLTYEKVDELNQATDKEIDEALERWKPAAGQVWEVGRHRLLVGNVTEPPGSDMLAMLVRFHVEQLHLNLAEVLVLTDPPYGINVLGTAKKTPSSLGLAAKFKPIIGDAGLYAAQRVYANFQLLGLKRLVLFGGNYLTGFLPPSKCWLIWDKQQSAPNFAGLELAWTSFERHPILIPYLWNGAARAGDKTVEGVRRYHPTQKPVGLFLKILELFPSPLVVDPFLGSGTTMLAAEKAGAPVTCLAAEIEPAYVAITLERLSNLGVAVTLQGEKNHENKKSDPAHKKKAHTSR